LVVGGILEEESSNEDGLWWYLENCWHGITTGSMNVTGKASAPRLVNHTFANVNLLGHVNDLVPLYETHKVFVAATRFATGIPWKVHEAMAHGIPCVISQLLADQLEIQDGTFAMVARDPQEFIDKSNELYSNKDLWNKIRQNGFELIRRDCDVGNFKNILSNALTDLAGGK
jgi:glycosyltransferase involved in cell wall biosynthesis